MNESFASYSPRVIPLNYDACANRTGVKNLLASGSGKVLLNTTFSWGVLLSQLDPETDPEQDGYAFPLQGYEADVNPDFNEPAYAGAYVHCGTQAPETGLLTGDASSVSVSITGGASFKVTTDTQVLPVHKNVLKISLTQGSYTAQ